MRFKAIQELGIAKTRRTQETQQSDAQMAFGMLGFALDYIINMDRWHQVDNQAETHHGVALQ